MPKIGFISHLPAMKTSATDPTAMPSACHHGWVGPASAVAGLRLARTATSASSGMIARSSSSRIATERWPLGAFVSPRSSIIFMITAVEDSTKPIAPITAAAGGRPNSMATPESSAPQARTCVAPRPKISRRMAHSLAGRISSPMRNRNITTPSSATWMIVSGSLNRPKEASGPKGPMKRPAAR